DQRLGANLGNRKIPDRTGRPAQSVPAPQFTSGTVGAEWGGIHPPDDRGVAPHRPGRDSAPAPVDHHTQLIGGTTMTTDAMIHVPTTETDVAIAAEYLRLYVKQHQREFGE